MDADRIALARTPGGNPTEEAARAHGLLDQGRRQPRSGHEVRVGRLPATGCGSSAQPLPRRRARRHRDHRFPESSGLEQSLWPPPPNQVRGASAYRSWRPARYERKPPGADCGDAGSSTRQTGRPKNGKIAFVDRTNDLEVINPNGSALRRLARCPVAITANNLSLYVINADVTGTRRLAHCGNCDQWSPVAWSPDGSSIVFAGDDGLHLISRVDRDAGTPDPLRDRCRS